MSPTRYRLFFALLLSLGLTTGIARGGTVEGLIFEDLNANGLLDPGEPGVEGMPLLLWWGDAMRFPGTSGADGTFSIPADSDSHHFELSLPEGWRFSFPDQTWDPPVAGPNDDVVLARWGSAQNFRRNAEAASDLLLVSLGDSIPAGFNLCAQDTDYIPRVLEDIAFITQEGTPGFNYASPGAHSEDLLTPLLSGGGPNPQFVGNVIADSPEIVTINIGGNDFLDSDGDRQANIQSLIDTRATSQEILSSLLIGLPDADLVLNVVYDNEADDCATSDFHARATPIWAQIVRWLGTGQVRPVSIGEYALDFSHQNVTRTLCAGAEDRICAFLLDRIHPTEAGSDIIQRATMEALGEVRVPVTGTIPGVQLGLLRKVAELEPSLTRIVSGAVTSEANALTTDDLGASVPPGAELRLSGFSLPPGITPSVIVVRVRFRTSGDFVDDSYRIDASVLDFQVPATFEWTNWDYLTPIVGGSGTLGSGQGLGNGLVNAIADRPTWVEASARLGLNAIDDGTVTGFYSWPAPTAADIASLQVRLRVAATGTADAAAVEWDSVVVEVYGQGELVVPGVGEVSDVRGGEPPLTVAAEPDGFQLVWDEEPGADSYRVYRGALPSPAGDGAAFGSATTGMRCSAVTSFLDSAAPGSVFWLVSAVDATGVEGLVGRRSDGAERTTAGADCP